MPLMYIQINKNMDWDDDGDWSLGDNQCDSYEQDEYQGNSIYGPDQSKDDIVDDEDDLRRRVGIIYSNHEEYDQQNSPESEPDEEQQEKDEEQIDDNQEQQNDGEEYDYDDDDYLYGHEYSDDMDEVYFPVEQNKKPVLEKLTSSNYTCQNGHTLYRFKSTDDHVEYNCDKCRNISMNSLENTFYCEKCDYRMCRHCADEDPRTLPIKISDALTCPKEHVLKQYASIYGFGFYSCDNCRRSLSNTDNKAYHCKECKYDLCPLCSDEDPRTLPIQVSPTLKCPKKHPLAVYLSVYGGGRYFCDNCKHVSRNSDETTYHCKECGYDLCPSCSNQANLPIEVSTLKCLNGHPLAQYLSIHDSKQYNCVNCKRDFRNSDQRAYHCNQCQNDLCPLCSDPKTRPICVSPSLKCPKGHPLAQYHSLYDGRQYFCDSCRRISRNSQERAYHCRQCKYDLCSTCSSQQNGWVRLSSHDTNSPKKCLKGHPISQCILPTELKIYRCVNCGHLCDNSKHLAYHCKSCQTNLCEMCCLSTSMVRTNIGSCQFNPYSQLHIMTREFLMRNINEVFFTIRLIVGSGMPRAVTMNIKDTLNKLAEDILKERGIRIRSITVGTKEHSVLREGNHTLFQELGVRDQYLVRCNYD